MKTQRWQVNERKEEKQQGKGTGLKWGQCMRKDMTHQRNRKNMVWKKETKSRAKTDWAGWLSGSQRCRWGAEQCVWILQGNGNTKKRLGSSVHSFNRYLFRLYKVPEVMLSSRIFCCVAHSPARKARKWHKPDNYGSRSLAALHPLK